MLQQFQWSGNNLYSWSLKWGVVYIWSAQNENRTVREVCVCFSAQKEEIWCGAIAKQPRPFHRRTWETILVMVCAVVAVRTSTTTIVCVGGLQSLTFFPLIAFSLQTQINVLRGTPDLLKERQSLVHPITPR